MVVSCEASPASHENLVEELVQVTQLCPQEARILLNDCEWDIVCAMKKFELESCSNDSDSHISPSTSTDEVSSESPSLLRLHTPGYTFSLPNLQSLPADFRSFLEKDLIETPTQRRLENSSLSFYLLTKYCSEHLNWWQAVGQKLLAMATLGDGSCLLHAASLGMWGFHDRQLMLRNALHEMLKCGSRRGALRRRWRWAESEANHALGLRLSNAEWDKEWEAIVEAASPSPRKVEGKADGDQVYESLEAIHVFALAHVLKRPIIVVSDTVLRNAKGEELSPVSFGGVYLPLECDVNQCHRSPLVLCYDSAHFSALVTMQQNSLLQQIVPITDANRNLLPLHFSVDPGPDFTWWKDDADNEIAKQMSVDDAQRLSTMAKYLDLLRLDMRRGSLKKTIPIRPNPTTMQKCMTLAHSGVTTNGDSASTNKKRILSEITQHVLRGLKLSHTPRLKAKDGVPVEQICAESLGCGKSVIAAKLITAGEAYMDELRKNYLAAARERFQNAGGTVSTATPKGHRRINRSFSASSVVVNCINRHCSKPATQTTNFLCEGCFEIQKELMTSFSQDSSGRPRGKSSTMPTLSQASPLTEAEEAVKEGASDSFLFTSVNGALTLAVRDMCQPEDSLRAIVRSVDDEDGVRHYFCDTESSQDTAEPTVLSS